MIQKNILSQGFESALAQYGKFGYIPLVMPTYDYECRTCGHSFETFQSMSDDSLTICPECGKPQLRRLISGGTGVIFKGSGFYVNDSRKKSSTSSPPASPTAAKDKSTSGSKNSKAKKTDSSGSGSSGTEKKASA